MAVDLMLDPAIRNWVLLPILLVMVLMTLLRQYVQQLLKSTKKTDIKTAQVKSVIARSARLRAAGRFISSSSFAMRKVFFLGNKHTATSKADRIKGALKKKVKGGAAANPMMGGNMMDGLKNNMTFMVSNMAMIGWISYFFSGFVLVKVPFPLTMRFKSMLQRGIELATLDASYVSTLSWYFIVMFGIRGILQLFLGEGSVIMDEARMMQMQMGMAGSAMNPGQTFQQLYKAEAESLHVAEHKNALAESEAELAAAYRAEA